MAGIKLGTPARCFSVDGVTELFENTACARVTTICACYTVLLILQRARGCFNVDSENDEKMIPWVENIRYIFKGKHRLKSVCIIRVDEA